MKRRAIATTCLLAGLMLLPGVTAFADVQSRTDRVEDYRPFLDIAKITHRHDGRTLVHRLSTHEAWATEDLDNGSKISFKFSFDEDHQAEREVRVDVEEGGLSAAMFSGGGRRIADVRVTRPDDRSVRIRFLPRLLEPGIDRYVWRTRVTAHGCDDPNTETNPVAASQRCWDYAPNDRRQIVHRL